MTLYLLDENVLKEMKPGGNREVAARLSTVPDSDLRLSVITFLEKRRGWERERKKYPERAAAGLAAIAEIEKVYADRIVPMGVLEIAEWARLLGAKDKNQRDMALAATARVHDMVVVTRNTADFLERDVRVLNPFKPRPAITRV